MRRLLPIVALLLPVAAEAVEVCAAGSSAGCDYTDLDAAFGSGATEITLRAESYPMSPTSFSEVITVTGAGSDQTTIDCTGISQLFTTSQALHLSALTVVGCEGDRIAELLGPGTTSTFDDVIFEGSSVSVPFNGGILGLTFQDVVVEITDSELRGGASDALGGQIHGTGATSIIIRDSLLIGGRASQGGCIATWGSLLELENVDFDGCSAVSGPGRGSAIYADAGGRQTVNITGGAFRDNGADVTGGAIHVNDIALAIDGTLFERNTAQSGGAIEMVASDVTITNADFRNNIATSSDGGAISGWRSNLTVNGGTFDDNDATGGGAIDLATDFGSYALTVAGTIFTGNEATSFGGGGAIFVSGLSIAVELRDAIFSLNTASSGKGGAAKLVAESALLDNVFIQGSSASSDGGAVYISGNTNPPDVRNSRFCDNHTVSGVGGALALDTGAGSTTTSSVFMANTAPSGGAGIWSRGSGVTMSNNHFLSNDGGDVEGTMVIVNDAGTADFHSNLVAFQPVGTAIAFFNSPGTTQNNAFFNLGAGVVGQTSSNEVLADPKLVTPPPYDASACAQPLFPRGDSPLIDNGLGADNDIGAFTGANWADRDEDGDPWDTDCDDQNSDVNHSATEICDGIDNDCEGTIDEGAAGGTTAWMDADNDGYGDPASPNDWCTVPSGWVDNSLDCADDDIETNPDGIEVCNSNDDDCDGDVDEPDAVDALTWHADGDGDTFGDPDITAPGCTAPTGFVADDQDCDDSAAAAHPGATEICGDGLDNDCEGTIDGPDAADAQTWYPDSDGDNFGDASDAGRIDCEAGFGELLDASDCDDADNSRYPGAPEVAGDGIDQDCDGADLVDEVDDADGDGSLHPDFGGDDCDDSDASIFPGATEVPYDGVDQDCDGSDLDDVDGDGHRAAEVGGDDCADDNGAIHPGADEVPYDGVDSDCDGADPTDVDGDGHDALVSGGGDCDDADDTIHPDAVDDGGVDRDCDGLLSVTVYGGSGCSAASTSSSWAWLALAGLLARRGRRAR